MKSDLSALAAVALWASLAALGASLSHLPPLLITGIGLLVGSLIALPLSGFRFAALKTKPSTLLLGVYGLFGYHFALFAALQLAPAVQANLVNYLWPLLIVVLAPMFIKTAKLKPKHVIAAVVGFVGAGLAILSGQQLVGGFSAGYLYALIAAVIWATYSLGTKAVGNFKTAAIGSFGFVAGILALVTHFLVEPAASIAGIDWVWLVGLGLGPLGGAFYLWDYALKNGNAQRVGLISFLTPLLSTAMLLIVTGQSLSYLLLVSAVLIFGAAFIGSRGE